MAELEYERPKRDLLPAEMRPVYENHAIERPEAQKTGHRWRQRGHVVHCDTCDPQHGFDLGPNQLLTGIDHNGYPMVSTIRG